jgi:hypothetical protein
MPNIKAFIVAISVGLLVAGILLPIGIGQIANANTTGWDAQTILVWGVIPVAGAVAVVLKLFDVI